MCSLLLIVILTPERDFSVKCTEQCARETSTSSTLIGTRLTIQQHLISVNKIWPKLTRSLYCIYVLFREDSCKMNAK